MKCITSIFGNIQAEMNNHRGLESVLVAREFKLLYLGTRTRATSNSLAFVDFDDLIDINEFDEIYLQLTPPTFYGGIYSAGIVKSIKLLADFNGTLKVLLNDPRILPINPAKAVYDRFKMCEAEIAKWDSLLLNATYVFSGKRIDKFLGYTPINVEYFDYFKLMFKSLFDVRKLHKLEMHKKFDVLYYGDKRGTFRDKELARLMPRSTNNLLVGYKTNRAGIDAEFMSKVKHSDLAQVLDNSRVSLILGDQAHYDNVTTFRFYETLASSCLAAIPLEYDPNKELIQDEELKDLLYVANADDVCNLVDAFSKHLIEKQRLELIRILKS